MDPVYLDYNATTPVDPVVTEAVRPYLELHYGNPSSMHAYGRQAKKAVENARAQLASLLNAHNDEIVFTSGGTESNNFAIRGIAYANRSGGNHIITTAIEHPSVTGVCRYLEKHGFRITFLPVDGDGMVDPDDVLRAISPQTILITVMHANNETGTIQPVEEIGLIARNNEILFHTDAAQSVGKIPVDAFKMKADLISVAGHKFYAPKGVGALYIRRGVKPEKIIHGADHESNCRAGTENVHGIAGLGMAAEIAHQLLKHDPASRIPHPATFIKTLRDRLHEGILAEIPGAKLNGHPDARLPNTLSIGFPGVDAALLLGEMKDIAASAGAACHAGESEISGVLAAMHVPAEYAAGTIRFSLGRMTTAEQIEQAIPVIADAYRKLRGEPAGRRSGMRITASELAGTGYAYRAQDHEIPGPEPEFRLTGFTHALGCACKIRPQLLEKILMSMPARNNPSILVGHETSDDAAVYKIDASTAIVQTVDFIPPIVDDPYMYGAIAAANALSDVYAMGGTPLFALGIVGFPDRKLPLEVLHQILSGANDKVAEAGIQVIGGHSIEDSEPKFGLVVTGLIHPDRILRNSTVKPGDALILTKPVGTGIITTAIKQGLADKEAVDRVMQVMAELNRTAADIISGYDVSACTDVTGFGLLGHLKEMISGAGKMAILDSKRIPILDAAWKYAAAGAIPGGTKNNLDHVREFVQWQDETPELMKFILADAQTSGGLLVSLPETRAAEMVASLRRAGIRDASVIGRIVAGETVIIV